MVSVQEDIALDGERGSDVLRAQEFFRGKLQAVVELTDQDDIQEGRDSDKPGQQSGNEGRPLVVGNAIAVWERWNDHNIMGIARFNFSVQYQVDDMAGHVLALVRRPGSDDGRHGMLLPRCQYREAG